MRLIITRHGQTDWNAEGRLQGHQDIPLNSTGISQAETLRDELAGMHFDLIIASPLSRAYKTAEIINSKHNLEILRDNRIKEIYLGKLEGQTKDSDLIDFGVLWTDEMLRPLDVELNRDFFARVADFTDEVAETYDGKDVLIVCHSGVYREFYQYFNGITEHYLDIPGLKNCEFREFSLHTVDPQDIIENELKTKDKNIKSGDTIRIRNSKKRYKVESIDGDTIKIKPLK